MSTQAAPVDQTADDKVSGSSQALQLTRGGLLARNTAWNLIGQFTPMLFGLWAIPRIIHGLGTDRFGLLTLVWLVIGYFSLFDFGLGRALTKLVAQKLGEGNHVELPAIISTAKLLMLGFGVLGGVCMALCTPWLVHSVLKIPQALQPEAVKSIYLLSVSIPFVISTAGLRGLLDAHQKFGLANRLRIPLGILTYAAPLLVIPFSRALVPTVALLAVGRVIAWLAHLIACRPYLPPLRYFVKWERGAMRPLLNFGTWMTVSNIVSPMMYSMDRLVLAAFVSMHAVAFYATPYEVITKAWLLTASVVGVLFPAFSATIFADPERCVRLFRNGCVAIALALFPAFFLVIAFADKGLNLWLGAEFAQNSTVLLRWLAVGVFINGVAQVPFALIQSAGRPDITAKLHVLELLFYAPGLWWLVTRYGVKGAAVAWTVRVAADAALLFAQSARFMPEGRREIKSIFLRTAAALAVLALAWLVPQRATVLVSVLGLLGFALCARMGPLRRGSDLVRSFQMLLQGRRSETAV